MDLDELDEAFADAGWGEWDLDDALMQIDGALQYMYDTGSL